MNILESLLSPLIWLMNVILNAYIELTGSVGISILLLSATFAILLMPLRKISGRSETRISNKMQLVKNEVNELKREKKLRGEELFHATEEIYTRHKYHPIHSMGLGLGFIVMLPVLISAIFLLTGNDSLKGVSFLFIQDLSQADRIFENINILPLIMAAITAIDAQIRYKGDKSSQTKFYIISVVLLVLVYNLSAGLVLYWIGSNLFSMVHAQVKLDKKNPV